MRLESFPPKPEARGEIVDEIEAPLRHYFLILWTHRWAAVAMFVLTVGIGVLITYRQQPVFRASASLLMEKGQTVLPHVDRQGQAWAWDPDYLITRLTILLKDDDELKELAKRSGYLAELKARRKAAMEVAQEVVEEPVSEAELLDGAARRLRGMISVTTGLRNTGSKESWQVASPQIAIVSVTDTDPQWTARIANALCDYFVESKARLGDESNRQAVEWLKRQVSDLETKLRNAERALNEFKRSSSVVYGSVKDGRSILVDQVRSINNSLSNTRMERMRLETRVATLEAAQEQGKERAVLRVFSGTEQARALLEQADSLQVQLNSLAKRYGPLHPRYQEVNATLAAVRRRYDQQAEEMVDGLRRQLDSVRSYEEQLNKALEEVKGAIFQLQNREIDYNHYAWEVETNKRLHGIVLQRLKETELAGMLSGDVARLLDRARVPEGPIRPRVSLNLLVSILLGGMLGFGLAMLLWHLDDTVKKPEDLAAVAGGTFLGMLPDIGGMLQAGTGFWTWLRGTTQKPTRRDLELHVFRNPNTQAAEYWRSLRTNLLFMSPDRTLRSIAISSAEASAGKTTTAVNLAVAMSQVQGRTLIVDADLRSPQLHRVFGVPNETGLSVAVTGHCTLQEAIKATEVPGLDVLTSGRRPPNPVELLHSERLVSLLEELRGSYRFIIFDLPPALGFADAAVLGQRVDGLILAARWEKTKRMHFREALAQLVDLNVPILGSVLTAVNLRARARYYDYSAYRMAPNQEPYVAAHPGES